MRKRKTTKSPFARDTHYLDCPDCGPKSQLIFFGVDLQGRSVYECPTCERRVGAPTLDQAVRERRMRD
jgi:DNA-directed RNA polymerase subunit RPC12/RpoP